LTGDGGTVFLRPRNGRIAGPAANAQEQGNADMSEIWFRTGEATVLAADGQYTDAMPEVLIGSTELRLAA
jgi:hypothetical protein